MNSSPQISVIVPVYKVEAYLERCINSVLDQTFDDFELILVDDGSPDNCPEMCDAFAEKDPRICVIHQENQGLSGARNSGIRIARGEYITFIDSDDWVSITMLEDLFRLSNKYDADISVCNLAKTSGEDVILNKTDSKITIYSKDSFMDVILKINSNRTIHYACGKLYKKHVLDSEHFPVGMLNEDVEGTFKAVMRSDQIVETSAQEYYYFKNEESITHVKFGNNFMCLNDVWQRVLSIAEREAPEYAEKVNYNLKRIDFTVLMDSILYGSKETDELYQQDLINVRKRLCANMKDLISGPMVFNRKLLVIIIGYCYSEVKWCYRIKNKIFRRERK